jgi:6-pyruvoyl-tetrahydropterin synthase
MNLKDASPQENGGIFITFKTNQTLFFSTIAYFFVTMAATSTDKTTSFEIYVSKDTFKFNAAHFVAFKGYRELLHGHNYKVGVRLLGKRKIGADGYLVDFGNVKDVTKAACKRLNEHFLCPIHSDVIKINTEEVKGKQVSVRLECEDGSIFVFPRQDVAMLPLAHATAEELAIYLYGEILSGLNADYLCKRGIHTMEITVAEAPGQEATFRLEIPESEDGSFHLDVRKYIMEGEVIPMPCLDRKPKEKKQVPVECCQNCNNTKKKFSEKLEKLVESINATSMQKKADLTTEDLKLLLHKF